MDISYAAITTCAMLMLYLLLTMNVGRMRGKTGLQAPAVVGDINFERAYRVQMNTLEWMVMAIPALWMYAALGSGIWASVAGATWIIGRLIYAIAYIQDPSKRSFSMLITMISQVWLLGGAVWASVISL